MRKKLYKQIVLSIILLLCISPALYAVKAKPGIVKMKQPNGSFVSVRVIGDDTFGYYKTLDGYIVAKDSDGYLHYADYSGGALRLSSIKVVEKTAQLPSNLSKSIPYSMFVPKTDNSSICFVAPLLYDNSSGNSHSAAAQVLKYSSVPVKMKCLVLLVEFSDVRFSNSNIKSQINSMLNLRGYSLNGATGSAADYFNDNLMGKASVSFDLSDVITLPNIEAYYGAVSGTSNDINPKQLIYDACVAASAAGVDFSGYDLNGDGVADNVFVLFAGYNQAEGGDPSTIWPHAGDISSMKLKCGGVQIANYACTSELKGYNNSEPAPIGTFCHEFGHLLGLVDMYDTNYDLEGLSTGLYKNLSLMDEGNYLNDGNTPPCFSAIEREMLGIGSVVSLESLHKYVLPPQREADSIYRLATLNRNEYFLIECRDGAGWDKYIGGKGMVIYHIDKSSKVWGGIESAKRWVYNNVNAFAQHQCAFVLSASGADYSALFYPGALGVNKITVDGDPSLIDWSGHSTGVEFNDIKYSNGSVQFYLLSYLQTDLSLPKPRMVKVSPYQNNCRVDWNSDIAAEGITWRIGYREASMSEDEYVFSDMTDKSVLIEGLLPDREYSLIISSILGNFVGEVYSASFKTMGITSSFPLMNIVGHYSVNSRIDLNILNISEPYKGIVWRINSMIVDGDSYLFNESKTYSVEAEIEYMDSTIEVIRKEVKVE